LVCHAAQHHDVRAHGVTLSQAQFDFAQAKIARLGLADRVTIELKDFRALTGEWDKIASIGMFEHVGLDNRDGYFGQIRNLLRPRGLYLHHAITRPMKKDEKSFRKKRPEFAAIVNYVFPGSELDQIGGTTRAYIDKSRYIQNTADANAAQSVDVMAANHAMVASSASALAIGGVGVSGALGTEIVERSTKAEISGGAIVYAKGAAAVKAVSTNSVAQISVGAAGGAAAGAVRDHRAARRRDPRGAGAAAARGGVHPRAGGAA
jgi:hypothetical protein